LVPTGLKAALHSINGIHEAKALFLCSSNQGRIQLATGTRHTKQKKNYHADFQWAVDIGQYHVDFVPRRAIKSQVLADFIAEWTDSYM
jgi:hypothetical protein